MKCPPQTLNCYDCEKARCPNKVKLKDRCALCKSPMAEEVEGHKGNMYPLCQKHFEAYNSRFKNAILTRIGG